MTDKDIRICDNKGFHLDMLNGVTVGLPCRDTPMSVVTMCVGT